MNPDAEILVEATAERDMVIFSPTPERPLGFIEAFGNVVQHCGGAVSRRGFEFLSQKVSCSAADEN